MNESEKMSVYIETSVISYLTSKMSRDLVIAAHQEISLVWWEKRRFNYRLFISRVVMDEITAGDEQLAQRRGKLVEGIRLLPITEEMTKLAKHFVEKGILPQKSAADALHVAIAAISKIDFVLSWNCRHIANAEIKKAIGKACQSLGYQAPSICTPLELLDRWDYEEHNR
ncbi:MAG: type II toxin-antitoxin system VapC family toxin [Symploca sp. SIO1B1]|nr:type II toxin-antitoxin system VapC family toxin [Symploca sp. SIO1B1]